MATNYQVIKTADELRRAIERMSSEPVVGLDTETTDLDPYTSRLRLIQLATPERVSIVDLQGEAAHDVPSTDCSTGIRADQ